jgi:hypothetical protein
MGSRRLIRCCALVGLIAPVMWGVVSLFPDRYPFASLAASKTFDLVTVTLWPWFLISAMAAFLGAVPAVVVYVASALINALWYAVVGQLLWIIVNRYRAARSSKLAQNH